MPQTQRHADRQRFYAISTERPLRHPAVGVVTQGARSSLFLSGNAKKQDA